MNAAVATSNDHLGHTSVYASVHLRFEISGRLADVKLDAGTGSLK
jgi:hypothetical protein